jgi:gamma-glutamyltranspeptidase
VNYKAKIETNRLAFELDDELRAFVPPPPSSGILIPAIMKIMKSFLKDKTSDEQDILFYHRFIEASKHLFTKRADLGDEDFLNLTNVG